MGNPILQEKIKLEEKDLKNIQTPIKKRQIIIETDGYSIKIVKAEVSGNLEFYGILTQLLKRITIK